MEDQTVNCGARIHTQIFLTSKPINTLQVKGYKGMGEKRPFMEQHWVNCSDVDVPRARHTEWSQQEKNKYQVLTYVLCLVTQSCSPLHDPVDSSPPGSSVHWIFQVIVLKWLAVSSSRGSSQPRDQTRVSCVSLTAGGFVTRWATGEVPPHIYGI